MSEDLFIEHVTESFVRLRCDSGILRELYDRFKYQVPNYKFMPSYKMGYFDGYIKLINIKTGLCPKGLVPEVIKYCLDSEYSVKLDPLIVQPLKSKIDFSIEDLQLPTGFEIRDYQQAAFDRAKEKKRQIILSSTGSGKSLIIYSTMRAIQSSIEPDEKILIIVPTINLVTQLYSDFEDYSKESEYDVSENVHKVFGGQEKDSNQQVIISTWQSIYKESQSFFEKFRAVLADEVHTFDAKSCTSIMDKCENALFRIGYTGTLAESKTHEMQLKGMFGPIHRVSSTKDLQDQGVLADLKIFGIVLKHRKDVCDMLKGATYADEVSAVVQLEYRNRFICNLAKTRQGNTLVLFQFVEKHGKPLHAMMQEMCPEKQVFMVYGGTEAEQRENTRKIAEQRSDVIILASYQTFSTGVNIKNLTNIIFASPTKSKIRVLQSVGRGLRTHKDKEFANLYDITDDLRGTRKTANYCLKHFMERYTIYLKENFDVEMKEFDL